MLFVSFLTLLRLRKIARKQSLTEICISVGCLVGSWNRKPKIYSQKCKHWKDVEIIKAKFIKMIKYLSDDGIMKQTTQP